VTDGAPTPERIVAALDAFPEELARLLDDQPREALVAPSSDGGPGVVELLPHLRDWEAIFLGRVDAIMTQDHPTLPAFDDDLWAIERDYRGQDPARVLAEFLSLRADLLDHLRHADEAAWRRTADHETAGEVDLLWLGNQVVQSDADHVAQIRDALS
jgi:hypothetical protein